MIICFSKIQLEVKVRICPSVHAIIHFIVLTTVWITGLILAKLCTDIEKNPGPSVYVDATKICQYQWSWDKPYSPGCNHLCPMLQFGSKHVFIEDVHIFKHCHEMTLFLLWIGTYCISSVVQLTRGVKDLSSLVRYNDSSLAAIRHVQSIKALIRPRPNILSHSVLLCLVTAYT